MKQNIKNLITLIIKVYGFSAILHNIRYIKQIIESPYFKVYLSE